jgi:hypothetical protein
VIGRRRAVSEGRARLTPKAASRRLVNVEVQGAGDEVRENLPALVILTSVIMFARGYF